MSQAKLIISVTNQEHMHANGLSGMYIVPAKKDNEEFALLVVYPRPEIQDIGDGRSTIHWPKVRSIARDIVGMNSDSAAHSFGSPGSKEKWGLLLCEAEPDLPKELIEAMEREIEFLNENPPDVKMRIDKKSGALGATNIESDDIKAQKVELSGNVQKLRAKFESECRSLVTKAEVARAKRNLLMEDQRMVAEADRMWASGKDAIRASINELHQSSCRRLGQERPWCYVPGQLVDCPGCGAKIKENILSCPACSGWLEEGIPELMAMHPKQRARLMYPERYAEPVGVAGPGQGAATKR